MPAERQRQTLDPPSEQPVTEILVKAPQRLKVNRMLINPYALHELPQAGGAHRQKRGLIHERQPIVQRCMTSGPPTSRHRHTVTPVRWNSASACAVSSRKRGCEFSAPG